MEPNIESIPTLAELHSDLSDIPDPEVLPAGTSAQVRVKKIWNTLSENGRPLLMTAIEIVDPVGADDFVDNFCYPLPDDPLKTKQFFKGHLTNLHTACGFTIGDQESSERLPDGSYPNWIGCEFEVILDYDVEFKANKIKRFILPK